MRFITWNCNMAFRKKSRAMLDFSPDILCVQECENEERLQFGKLVKRPNDFLWVGVNNSKGLAIFTYGNYKLKLHEKYSSRYKYIVPVVISGDKNFILFHIWAMPHKEKSRSYIGQIWYALNYYRKYIGGEIILAGDFNSNAQWDSERVKSNHSAVVAFLDQRGIKSIYHLNSNDIHGNESDPTLYLLKNKLKPYHMDYCFASENMINEYTSIQIGRFEDWIELSDHMPLIVDFE